jgi:hypothetical protein
MHAAHGQYVRLVEVRERCVMLALLILHDESAARIERVDRKPPAAPVRSRVAYEPVELVLPRRSLAEQLIAEVDDVRLG